VLGGQDGSALAHAQMFKASMILSLIFKVLFCKEEDRSIITLFIICILVNLV
jgi:hypothetical protein